MNRRLPTTALLLALLTVGTGVPRLGVVSPVAAASCSGWSSHTEPPPTIRVFRHETGAVESVPFKAYTKNVLSREWIGSWTRESLRSGALAVKNYAWYQVLHWRGGTSAGGDCFDLRDDTWDQVYDPNQPVWSTAAAAVDDTWGTLVHKGGRIFPTYYNAGRTHEPCGANANGWKAYQWGMQACGLDGLSAAEIVLTYYYPGVTVSGAPAPRPTPSPAPTPTPMPTPSPAPTSTPVPTPKPTPGSSPTAEPTPSPAPTSTPVPTPPPTPTPLPTPPPDQQLPGGGQAGVEGVPAPPAPPSAEPQPVVAAAAAPSLAAPAFSAEDGGRELRWAAAMRRLKVMDRGGAWWIAAARADDPRLATFQALWGDAVAELVAAVEQRLTGGGLLACR